ncbi:MAG: hypothetical protein AB1489_40740, partial [Acidobacteriota bacterium]
TSATSEEPTTAQAEQAEIVETITSPMYKSAISSSISEVHAKELASGSATPTVTAITSSAGDTAHIDQREKEEDQAILEKLRNRTIKLRGYYAKQLRLEPESNEDLAGKGIDELNAICTQLETKIRNLLKSRIIDLYSQLPELNPKLRWKKIPDLDAMTIMQLDKEYNQVYTMVKELQEKLK